MMTTDKQEATFFISFVVRIHTQGQIHEKTKYFHLAIQQSAYCTGHHSPENKQTNIVINFKYQCNVYLTQIQMKQRAKRRLSNPMYTQSFWTLCVFCCYVNFFFALLHHHSTMDSMCVRLAQFHFDFSLSLTNDSRGRK